MNIHQTFDILADPGIDGYIAAQQEEHLLLDFKTVGTSDLSQGADKKNLAKALSGFANSDGGLIVWGVDARKNGDGIDCAVGKQPIPDLALFVSRLNALTGEAVSPLVEGVRHRAVSAGKTGFAVSLVPASDIGPHMAKLGEDRYYKRSGDSFYKMEHYDIADMFGRRRRPELSVEIDIGRRANVQTGGTVEHSNAIAIFLKNEGRASAKNLFVQVTVSPPYSIGQSGPEADGRGGLPRLSGDGNRQVSLGGNSGLVIHPGMRQGVVAVAFTYDIAHPFLPDLAIDMQIAADDMPLHSASRVVQWSQIYHGVR